MSDAPEGVMQQVLAEPIRATSPLEVDLIVNARAGDRAAFDRLMVGRLEPAYRTAMAILGNEADARDATQEAFVKTWRDLRSLRAVDRFDAWFGRILVNTCRSMFRRRRRTRVREVSVTAIDGKTNPPTAPSDDPLEARAAELDLLERAFRRLTVDERTLLVLHHLDHRSVPVIAAAVGIPEGTVKSRLHHARRALERALEVERR